MARCRYAVLRWEPNPLRAEVLNVGVVIHTLDPVGVLAQFAHPDTSRLQQFVSVEQHQRYQKILDTWSHSGAPLASDAAGLSWDHADALPQWADHLPSGFRLGRLYPALTDDPDRLLRQLFRIYVSVVDPAPSFVTADRIRALFTR